MDIAQSFCGLIAPSCEIVSREVGPHIQTVSAWALLGVLIFVPLAVAAIFRPSQRSSGQIWRLLHFTTVGMIYPAVLGSILYDVLPAFAQVEISSANFLNVLLLLSVITHFCFDYTYIRCIYAEGSGYGILAFATDMFIALALYLSAVAVNIRTNTADVPEIVAIFGLIYVAYFVWDLSYVRERGILKLVPLVDFLFAVTFLFLYIIGSPVLPVVIVIMIGNVVLAGTSASDGFVAPKPSQK